jgi:hypothetical protein
LAKRAKQQPIESMSVDDLRKDLSRRGLETKGKRNELVARVTEHRSTDAVAKGAQRCHWRGMVCELAVHLSESCALEPIKCPNAVAGCKELMLRSDAARHASEACSYRKSPCAHCKAAVTARDLRRHQIWCPQMQVQCPNVGCDVTIARDTMRTHRQECGWQVVKCPCPGCDKEMLRVEVEEHVEASGALHLRSAWRVAEEMEGKVTSQAHYIDTLEEQVEGLQKRAEALTHVFTFSTKRSEMWASSAPFQFTDGVRGRCEVSESDHKTLEVGFVLLEGPRCTLHYKCSILDKGDKAFRVISPWQSIDFGEPPTETAPVKKP